MFQFTIGMDPNLAQIGPLTLAWHGVLTAIAIFIAVAVIHRDFARAGLSLEKYDSLAFWTIVSGIIGARVLFIIDHIGYFIDHPVDMFRVTEGGLAIYGAVIGGFIGVAVLTRIFHYPFRPTIDAIAPGLILAQAFGRLGCLINGDAWGGPTSSPFALIYTHPDALIPDSLKGVPTHPYPIYDLVMNLAIFGVLVVLRKRNLPDGALFAIFAALYATARFFISFVRQENVWFWGMQEAQVVSLVVLVLSVIAFVWLLRSGQKKEIPLPVVAN